MITANYHRNYLTLNKDMDYDNLSSMLNVLTRARDTMKSPRMMHFISEIKEPDLLPSKLIQTFKEKFESEIKARNKQRLKADPSARKRSVPDIEMICSIETSFPKIEYSDGNPYSFGMPLNKRYDHIHIMLIVDTNHNAYGWKELVLIVNKAISRINGLDRVNYSDDSVVSVKDDKENFYGFFKPRDERCTIQDSPYLDKYWHDLKLEFPDAVIRASYLCKTTQKAEIPARFKKNSFKVTRARNACNEELQSVA